MTSDKIIKTIKADGWYLHRVKGSHHHFKHPTKPGLVTVAHPTKDLPVKTVASIFKQAQIQLWMVTGLYPVTRLYSLCEGWSLFKEEANVNSTLLS